ncbi:hypothetical protein N7532_001893 [Penicillium argentinense]|uniref:Zn(2)-C6 fungal-type domain-containing protein n=1 Tax=Penicillium argentinense TaxID=1131581 RepID=A0A9W9KMV5_9EURO|nr:uncharacterized protein N7532_001893 [Penicillium argentinense]KAJ5111358.1 hypothetical protein N7532_001893 [Penicillium argentinense]
MSRKRQQNQNYSPPREGSKSQNEGPSKQSKPHSAPVTPKRPPLWGASSAREGKESQSAPLMEEAGATPNAKVAIPRQPPGNTPRYNRRVPRACESCRTRKTKCSGDTPICRQCRELRVSCQYPVGWREKMKNPNVLTCLSWYNSEIDRLTAEVQDYENFINDLRSSADNHTADWIKGLIDKHGLKGNPSFDNLHSQLSTPQNEVEDADASPLSSIGSLEAIDRVQEDLNRTKHTRATGYMGKSSEISWMQRLQKEAEQRARGNPGSLDPNTDGEETPDDRFSLHALNYHLDDLEISVSEPVQLYGMPSRHLAHRLFDDYLKTVHPFFPIISKPLFRAQFQTFFDSSARYSAARPGNKWLAILNTIFAIAAKHAHLINAPWRGDENDHLMYLARARQLSMNSEVLFSHPDLQQVQVEGLIAFYLLASDQINRAWRISALAVRSAITLGINLKIDTPRTPNVAKEARYRVWWCLYSFEHMLGIMTGRAIYSLDGGYATPLPLPFEEEQLQEEPKAVKLLNDPAARDEHISALMASCGIRQTNSTKDDVQRSRSRDRSWLRSMPLNSGLCYLYYCDLTVITQEIVNKVFSTNSVTLMWSEIEARLDELKARIDLWQSSLPKALDFTQEEADDDPAQLRYKLFLAFHYYGARITLGRPCLCRRDARQTNTPQTFSHIMAVITLNSASGMLDLIPDEPNVLQLYKLCPWWCVLRYLMQAATVILLELSFGSVHMPEEEQKLVRLSKKCIRWFHSMSERSVGSHRAWVLCDSIFRKLACGMKYGTDDIPSKPQEQQGSTHDIPTAIPNFFGPVRLAPQDYFNFHLEDLSLFGPRPPAEEDIWTNYFNLPTPDLMPPLQGHPSSMPEDTYFPLRPARRRIHAIALSFFRGRESRAELS